ncbi:Rer1 family-domain-containing protein [Chytridium lagenaria]|nr:Rer1 family-domain-containing protein [Chytridium lagenaria]
MMTYTEITNDSRLHHPLLRSEMEWHCRALPSLLYPRLASLSLLHCYVRSRYLPPQPLLAFLQPKFDPALEDGEDEDDKDGMALPTKIDDEFRPFIRRLPEFKFWYWATRGITTAFLCTFFPFLDVPVFWPILLMYFIVLFALTMKQRIKHMVKYK